MGKNVDITGKRFGKLVAVKRVDDHVTSGGKIVQKWLFKCDCGEYKIIRKMKVMNESQTGCGCGYKYKDRTLPNINGVYGSYKKGARARNLTFNIPFDTFKLLIKQNCTYCNLPPYTKYDRERGIPCIYNGLDRVDNLKGYELDNVVTCCKNCNHAKLNLSKEDFLDMIKRIYENLKLNT